MERHAKAPCGRRHRNLNTAKVRRWIAIGALLSGAVFEAWAAEPVAISAAMRLAGEAVAAGERGDNATYLAKMEEAVALRPDVPTLLSNLAAAQVAAEQPEKAIETLGKLTTMGLVSPVEQAEEFAALKGRKDFAELVKKFAANKRPVGKGEIAFTLSEVRGLIEGIAWRAKTGEFYFGDVNERAIWRRAKDGKLHRLTPPADELLGVFGLVLDEANGAIWAATSAVPAMRGYTPEQQGSAALAEIDLANGTLRRTVPVPPPQRGEAMNQLRSLVLAEDGSIYLADTGEPFLWRLPPGGQALELCLQHPEFISLRGMAITPAGVALVADRINGLLRVELGSGAVQRFDAPENTTLVGVEGLAPAPGNAVFALQGGVRPPRVLRVNFDPAVEAIRSVTVVEAAHFTLAAPTHGCAGPGGDFYFVGNGGWARFESGGETPTPKSVPIFRIQLGGAGKK